MLAVAFLLFCPARDPAKASNLSRNKALWKSNATVVPFENMEGIIMVRATLRSTGGRDTTGVLVLDTGAGYVALDAAFARAIGMENDEGPPTGSTANNEVAAIGIADRPLPRLEIGGLQFDQMSPVLTIDGSIIRQVTDRPVFGLLGARPLTAFAVVVDYRQNELGLIPISDSDAHDPNMVDRLHRSGAAGEKGPRATDSRANRDARIQLSQSALGDAIHGGAQPIAFRLRGDDKILVSVRVANPDAESMSDTLTLIVDTGATKTALFGVALAERAPRFERWRTLRGLTAPTLVGSAEARIARLPVIEVLRDSANVSTTEIDAAIIESPLAPALSADVGEPVHGLLGYSFLRRFRVVIDYPHQVLWLESIPHTKDDRLYEYTHVGLQLERRGAALSVVGVATGSPAALAGIERADELVAIDDTPAAKLDVIGASRRLEGRAGTSVVLRVRRGDAVRTLRLQRRRLL